MIVAKPYTEEEETTMRTCTKCNVEKPLSFYYRLGSGFEKVCKDCRNLRENTYTPVEPVETPKPVKKPTKRGKKSKS